MAKSSLPPVSRQAAANCDRFEALQIGSTFCVYARGSYRLIQRYCKVAADTIQVISEGDSRQWPFATCEASGASVILVPDGARSVLDYVALAVGQRVRTNGSYLSPSRYSTIKEHPTHA